MEGQTKDKPMKLQSHTSLTVDNKENQFQTYSNELIQEAEAFANSINQRLAKLNEEDAEMFMTNFEKNVMLLPKNTKNVTKSSNLLPAENSNESGHDFVLLDSDDTATANNDEMPKGITLFGTSLKYSQKLKPFAFLEDDFKSNNNEHEQKEKDSNDDFSEECLNNFKSCNQKGNAKRWNSPSCEMSKSSTTLESETQSSNTKMDFFDSVNNKTKSKTVTTLPSTTIKTKVSDKLSKTYVPKAEFIKKISDEIIWSQKVKENLMRTKNGTNDTISSEMAPKPQTEFRTSKNPSHSISQQKPFSTTVGTESKGQNTKDENNVFQQENKCISVNELLQEDKEDFKFSKTYNSALNQNILTQRKRYESGDSFQHSQYSNATNLPSKNVSSYKPISQRVDPKTYTVEENVFNLNPKLRSPLSQGYTNMTEKIEKTVILTPDEKSTDPLKRKQPPTKSETVVSRPLNLQAISTQVGNVTQQQNDWLQKSSSQSSNRKSINILVLGQTGVGKSTWINAFANYLTYSTLEDAIAAEAPVCVIPTKFSMFDENYQRHDVLLGNHSNEVFSDKGQSATQNAKTYLFEKDDYDIYIIDTPGMDDTRGPNQDDENIQKILRVVSPFKELHAICFLFKANESRLTQSFKYCISKLLGNLSKSALNNACFVFTNARGTFYKPGDTMGPLKAYFKELYERERLAVTINDGNTFCLDNEAFRFICAYFSKMKFGDMDIKTYADSWKHSANEIIRLLNYSARLRPHSTSETLSVNETRTWILQLVKPVVDVSAIMQTNMQQLGEQIHQLEVTNNNIQDLQKRAAIPITALETFILDKPQTVCSSTKCITYESIDGNLQPIYTTVCHKPCYLELNNVLENCAAFTFDTCNKCGCKVNEHKRITYQQKIVTKHLETQALRNSLASEVDASKVKKRLIRDCEKMTDGYKKELNFVLYAMANFSTFLAQNGISQNADIFEKHLENSIQIEEKMFRSVKYSNDKKYKQSIELLKSYQDTRQKIINENPSSAISLVQIQDIRQKLFSMPLTGSKIDEIFKIHVEADSNDHAENVTRYDPKSIIRQCFNWTKNNVSSFMGRFRK